MSAAEAVSALVSPGSSRRSVSVEHLDYSFIQSCSDLKHLEQILTVLRSGQEGFYPRLIEFCEKRIEKLDPKSRVLRKENRPATAASFSTEEWRNISEDLQMWESNMRLNEAQLKRRLIFSDVENVPPVRSSHSPIQTSISAAVKTVKTSCVPRSHRDWDRFDVETECTNIDESERNKHHTSIPPAVPEITPTINSTALTMQEKDALARREKDKGNEAFRSGDYEEAVVYYSRSLSLASSAAAINNRAQAHIRLQLWSSALTDCDAVLQLEPGNVKALLRRATALKHLGQQQKSHDDLRAVLQIEPHNATALKLLMDETESDRLEETHSTGRKILIQEVDEEEEDVQEESREERDTSGTENGIMGNTQKMPSCSNMQTNGPTNDRSSRRGDSAAEQTPVDAHTGAPPTGHAHTGALPTGHAHTGDLPTGHTHTRAPPTGHAHTGDPPTGHTHTRAPPTGHAHTGALPTGHAHTGDLPTGHTHTRAPPTGHAHTGDPPTGHTHTRAPPTGHAHTGALPTGHAHTGDLPTGHTHTRAPPTGHAHTGDPPTGHTHTRAPPTGHAHTGAPPTGHAHTGAPPTGHAHTGAPPTGHAHTGAPPTGHAHTGDPPTGHAHTRDLPTGHAHTGAPPTGHAHTGAPPTGHAHLRIEGNDLSGETQTEKNTHNIEHTAAEFALLKDAGNALVRSGRYQEAVDRYTECLQLKPHECAVYTNRALCFIKLQRFTEARQDCDSALQLQPTNKKAFYRRALANKGLKDYAACRSDLQQVLCLDVSVMEAEQLLMEVTHLMTESRCSSGPRRSITITEVEDEDDGDEGSGAEGSSVSLQSSDVFEFGQALNGALSRGDLLSCSELLRSAASEGLPQLIRSQLNEHMLGFIIRALNTHLLHTHPILVFHLLLQLHTTLTMVLMLLDGEDRTQLSQIFQKLHAVQTEAFSQNDVTNLANKYL